MNDSRFDDIARRIAGASRSRRGLLRASAGIGMAVTVGVPEMCGAAPVGRVAPVRAAGQQASPDQLLIQQIAFDLDYDMGRIFRFVADEIAYESYAGALRGVRGTVWSGAGNSVDQAQLLTALLAEAEVDVRFAIGSLPEADATRLVDAMAAPPAVSDTLTAAREAEFAPDATPAASPTAGQPEAQGLVDRVAALRGELLATASAAVDDEVAALSTLLDGAAIPIPERVVDLSASERERHTWVQARRGAEWVDLDPTFAGAEIGRAPATLSETITVLPPDRFHAVTFKLVVETLAGDQAVEQTMLDYTFRSQDLVGADILISHLEPEALSAIGSGINEALSGQLAFYPLLFVGEEGFAADAQIVFGGDGGVLGADVLGGGGGLIDGECLSERYEVTVTSPGATPTTVARTLFDRVPPDQRRSGTIDPAAIPAIVEVDLGAGQLGLPEINRTVALASVVSAVDPDYLGRPIPEERILSALTGAVHGIAALRESLDAERLRRPGLYLDRPNVSAYVVSTLPAGAGDPVRIRLDADLLVQGYGFRSEDDAVGGIYAGVLAQAAERLALDERLFSELLDARALPSMPELAKADVAAIFAAARASDVEILVLSGTDAAPDGLGDAVASRIAELVTDGKVVLVPSEPVSVDGEPTIGWWVFDPRTGSLHDELADGRGGASLVLTPFADYITLVRNALKAAKPYLALGGCIAALLRAAASMIQQVPGREGALANVSGNWGGAIVACAVAGAAA